MDEMNQYTTAYEWFFPHVPRLLPDGRLTLTYEVALTVPQLAENERMQVLNRFHRWLHWLTQKIQDLAQIELTDQLLWRCFALAYVQVQRTFFSLEQVGFLLLANGVEVRKDLIHLHGLLQTFVTMPGLPGFETYYRLPVRLARPEDGSLDLALSVSGRARSLIDGWIYLVEWNALTHSGKMSISPSAELAALLGSTTDPTFEKTFTSEEARNRSLTETNGEYQSVSLQHGWIPCW